jgi:hypothetical protein
MKTQYNQTLLVLIILLYSNLFTIQKKKTTAHTYIKKRLLTKTSALLCLGSLFSSTALLYFNKKHDSIDIPICFTLQNPLLLFLSKKYIKTDYQISILTGATSSLISYFITDMLYPSCNKAGSNLYVYVLASLPTATYILGAGIEEWLLYKQHITNKEGAAKTTLLPEH